VEYLDEGIYIRGKVPLFLKQQIESFYNSNVNMEDKKGVFDWKGLAKGRHSVDLDIPLDMIGDSENDLSLPLDSELLYDETELE
jgi:hypothetical protein